MVLLTINNNKDFFFSTYVTLLSKLPPALYIRYIQSLSQLKILFSKQTSLLRKSFTFHIVMITL